MCPMGPRAGSQEGQMKGQLHLALRAATADIKAPKRGQTKAAISGQGGGREDAGNNACDRHRTQERHNTKDRNRHSTGTR